MAIAGVAIDWLHFTPSSALAGGALIGLAASLFVLLNGRIAGISGLLGSVLESGEGRGEKALFLLGLLLAPLLWRLFGELPAIEFHNGWLGLTLAGLLALATGLLSFCPASAVGINTCKIKR